MRAHLLRLLALILFCAAADAEATGFIGQWANPDPKASGLTHVAISPNGGDRVDVRAYGDCHPIECDWGIVQGKTFSANPKTPDVEIIVATFHYGFAHRTVTLRKAGKGKLDFEMTIEFADNSQRHDYVVRGNLRETVWPGPIAQVWQKQAGLATGWGGGARSGAPQEPKETCQYFNVHGARAVQKDGQWFVAAGKTTLVEAGRDDKAAQIAEAAIRHYKFDRRCTVGGPWQAYWKSPEGFAREKIGGPGCVAFQPTTAHLTRVGRDWVIMDGVATVANFAANKPKAEATMGLIRSQRLNGHCYVRYPDPIMEFWVTNADAQQQ